MSFKWFLFCCFVIVIFRPVYTQNEGGECTTKDNEPGICKEVPNCLDYFMMMRSKHGKNLPNHLKFCTKEPKQFLICCKSELQPPTTQSPTTPVFKRSELACQSYQRLEENYRYRNKICMENRVNGSNAEINEFPHIAAIGYDKESSSDYEFLCSGALISEKYILTAVHCVNKRNQVPRIARLGKTSLNNDDCNNAIDVKLIFDLSKFHKSYSETTKNNDIALLELEVSVDQFYSRNLHPACLHHGFDPIRELTVIGFEATVSNRPLRSNWLQKDLLNEMALNTCREKFKGLQITIFNSQLCATSPDHPADACQGDSGGPLQYRIDGTYFIAGIVSSFCGVNLPGVFVRVSSYIDWIEDIVWPQISKN